MVLDISGYTLKIKNNLLLDHAHLHFQPGGVNHIVGKNGVGKSRLAKDFILNKSGFFPKHLSSNLTVISSYSNIPEDISAKLLFKILIKRYDRMMLDQLSDLLNIENIPSNILIKNLSDGQKQKLKLVSFLLENKEMIILDEITNSLDKTTVNEIHQFLNIYSRQHSNKIILNITHNLSDLKNIEGRYFLFQDKKLVQYENKDQLIKIYIEE